MNSNSTINIVIEPEKEISIKVKLGPLTFTERVKNSVLVHHLKRQLIDGDIVGFKFKDFSLLASCVDNDGIPADIPLQDESLPLHLCRVGDNTTMRVIGGRVAIKLVNQKGQGWYKTFSRSMIINQMKQTILSTDSLFSADEDKNLLKDIWLFVERGDSYRELDDEAKIGAILSDEDAVYFIEDRFFPEAAMISVNRYGEKIGSVGCSVDDTVLSVKLRVQAQFGFPMSRVRVSSQGFNLKNDRTILNGIKYRISVE